jgi:hypothetical protein
MTTAQKQSVAKKKALSTRRLSADSKNAFRKSDWILIPLGLIVATCLTIVVMKSYVLTYLLTPQFYDAFWFPPFPSLLIAIFGILYIYKTLQRKPIGKLAELIAYTLLLVFVIFIIQVVMILAGKGQVCSGLFGVPTECSEVNAMMLSIFFANPYSLTLLSSLAILGIASLLLKRPR